MGVNFLIHKVNRPDLQLIVSSPKATENDPGSSQGGGVAYERLPGQQDQSDSSPESEDGFKGDQIEDQTAEKNAEKTAEQIGLGEVLREFKESQKAAPVRPGLAIHYQTEGGNAKGLLLNKKVE